MDFDLNPDQRTTIDALETLLARHGGPARARSMRGRQDTDLNSALVASGFLDLALDPDSGPLDAFLVVEAAARQLSMVNVGARALVAPLVLGYKPPDTVTSASADRRGPVRFGADAALVLVLDGDDVRLVEPAQAKRVVTGYIAPYGEPDLEGGIVMDGAGPLLRRWWRVALAAEISGLLSASLDFTVKYLNQRVQFGKPLSSLQAIQHRLAECYVWVDATAWLARSATWRGDDEGAALAATYAAMAARHVATELHQLTGAIGFSEEYDLHLWTMQARALATELGGIREHTSAVAAIRRSRSAVPVL